LQIKNKPYEGATSSKFILGPGRMVTNSPDADLGCGPRSLLRQGRRRVDSPLLTLAHALENLPVRLAIPFSHLKMIIKGTVSPPESSVVLKVLVKT
jgi:hypothetical protein